MFKAFKVASAAATAIALMLVVAAYWPGSGSAAAAGSQRQVALPIAHPNEALVITKITLGNATVQPGRFIKPTTIDPVTPFQADDDWIQNLSVYLLNRTNMTIVSVNLRIFFPETATDTRPQGVITLNLGRIPDRAAFDRNGNSFPQLPERQPLSFRPGQTMVVALDQTFK